MESNKRSNRGKKIRNIISYLYLISIIVFNLPLLICSIFEHSLFRSLIIVLGIFLIFFILIKGAELIVYTEKRANFLWFLTKPLIVVPLYYTIILKTGLIKSIAFSIILTLIGITFASIYINYKLMKNL